MIQKFNFVSVLIDGLYIVERNSIKDERGSFCRFFCAFWSLGSSIWGHLGGILGLFCSFFGKGGTLDFERQYGGFASF